MKISIIGAAGTVGSCTTFALALRGLADEIIMLDEKQNILGNHAMDINTAVSGMHNISVRTGQSADLTGTDVTIVCAGIHFPGSVPLKDRLAANIPIIKNIAANLKKYCPESIILMVTNPIDTLTFVIYLTGYFDRKKLLGYNLNDSIRFRAATAKALGIGPLQVAGIAAGYHPTATVSLFSSLKVDGKPVSLDAEKKQRILDESRNYLKALDAFKADRTAGWTTAAGLAMMVEAIRDDAGVIMPCSAVLDGEYGYHDLSLGVPAVIGEAGINKILEWDLPLEERRELDAVAEKVKAECALAKSILES